MQEENKTHISFVLLSVKWLGLPIFRMGEQTAIFCSRNGSMIGKVAMFGLHRSCRRPQQSTSVG